MQIQYCTNWHREKDIAALLVPLHHKLEKWATHKLVEKNKQIRLVAAKKTLEKLEG